MLKFGRLGMTRPECFPKLFNIYVHRNTNTETGRIQSGEPELAGTFKCILSLASPGEKERFSQIGVTVTHSILQRGSPVAKEMDVLALVKNGTETRRFRVQAVHNKGEMDIDTMYYCEERRDL